MYYYFIMSNELLSILKKHFYFYDKLKLTNGELKKYKNNNDLFFNECIKPIDNHAYYILSIYDQAYNPIFIKPKIIFLKTKLKIMMYDFPGLLAKKYSLQYINIINNAIYKAKNLNLNIEIDLSNNQGGYEPTMIISLQSLFDDDIVLYQEINKKIYNFYLSSFAEYTDLKFKKFKYEPSQITIKISHKTASAGEIVALSFVSKLNVKFIGNQSAGQLTHAYNHFLKNGDLILFTTGLFMKNNKIVKHINPQILI